MCLTQVSKPINLQRSSSFVAKMTNEEQNTFPYHHYLFVCSVKCSLFSLWKWLYGSEIHFWLMHILFWTPNTSFPHSIGCFKIFIKHKTFSHFLFTSNTVEVHFLTSYGSFTRLLIFYLHFLSISLLFFIQITYHIFSFSLILISLPPIHLFPSQF